METLESMASGWPVRATFARVVQLSVLSLVAPLLCAADCQPSAAAGSLPQPDPQLFVDEVYPMLLRDCGFSACHGAPQRFLQIFGPGRSRLSDDHSEPGLRQREQQLSYDRALSMLTTGSSDVSASFLLLKPLDVRAGGASHGGVDVFGRDVFQSIQDPRYLLLLRWARSRFTPAMQMANAPAATASAEGQR